jgi:hypothetical protein
MLFCLCSLQAEPLQQFFEKPGEEPQPPQACQIWKRSLGCCSWHFRVDQRAHHPWPWSWSWFTQRHEKRQPFKCLFCRVVPQEIWVVADRHKDDFSPLQIPWTIHRCHWAPSGLAFTCLHWGKNVKHCHTSELEVGKVDWHKQIQPNFSHLYISLWTFRMASPSCCRTGAGLEWALSARYGHMCLTLHSASQKLHARSGWKGPMSYSQYFSVFLSTSQFWYVLMQLGSM